jgi:hypothetical protein
MKFRSRILVSLTFKSWCPVLYFLHAYVFFAFCKSFLSSLSSAFSAASIHLCFSFFGRAAILYHPVRLCRSFLCDFPLPLPYPFLFFPRPMYFFLLLAILRHVCSSRSFSPRHSFFVRLFMLSLFFSVIPYRLSLFSRCSHLNSVRSMSESKILTAVPFIPYDA